MRPLAPFSAFVVPSGKGILVDSRRVGVKVSVTSKTE